MNSHKRLKIGIAVACLALAGGSVLGATATAKKKKKKGGATVTAVGAPATIPPGVTGPPFKDGVANVPLTIGKKAKKKIVAPEGVKLTFALGGTDATIDDISLRLIAPNGRTLFIAKPDTIAGETTLGPLTLDPNSPLAPCEIPPPGPCADLDQVLFAPYAGTLGYSPLANFIGLKPKGTWILRAVNNDDAGAVSLTSVKLEVATADKPSTD